MMKRRELEVQMLRMISPRSQLSVTGPKSGTASPVPSPEQRRSRDPHPQRTQEAHPPDQIKGNPKTARPQIEAPRMKQAHNSPSDQRPAPSGTDPAAGSRVDLIGIEVMRRNLDPIPHLRLRPARMCIECIPRHPHPTPAHPIVGSLCRATVSHAARYR